MSNVKVNTTLNWTGDYIKVQGKKVINKSTWETGLIVEGQAKELCARRYGYLAASINTQSSTDGTELDNPSKFRTETPPEDHDVSTFREIEKPKDINEVFVGTAVSYGPYIEFGTVKMNAQPFLRSALDLSRGEVLTIVKIYSKFYFGDYLTARDIFLAI